MFVATITFHGGDKSITYEWGDEFHNSPRFYGSTAPDHFAMHSIAIGMNNFSDGNFKVGPTNSIVYAVRGGMEEWSYAGSWFNQLNSVKTVPPVCGKNISVKMTEVSNRCLTFLVESDYSKTPSEGMLGLSENLFEKKDSKKLNNLIRQCLLVTDILQPYAHFPRVVEGEEEKGNKKGKSGKITVRWSISGCFQVDSTEVRRMSWDGNRKKEKGKRKNGVGWLVDSSICGFLFITFHYYSSLYVIVYIFNSTYDSIYYFIGSHLSHYTCSWKSISSWGLSWIEF